MHSTGNNIITSLLQGHKERFYESIYAARTILLKQLNSLFSLSNEEQHIIISHLKEVSNKCYNNFKHSKNKYYKDGDGEIIFNPFHSVQYMIFLYYLSSIIFDSHGSIPLCDKIYYLNKILNSVDLFYAIKLPEHFDSEHPLGSVMGRAKYTNGFFFYQGCTVGGTRDKNGTLYYPKISENVTMYSNSSILGKCQIGKNVKIGAGCIIKNQDIPSDCIVFGQSPNLIIKRNI